MRTFGLIGKTLGHSFSKDFFTRFFEEQHIDAVYNNFELSEISEVTSLLRSDLSGLNVTIPYKEEIIPFLDELSDEAKVIGAVNCIQFRGQRTIGHNTDAYGFHQSVKPFLTNRHERAMILGTGGAAKAVAHVLNMIGIDVVFISRSPNGPKQFTYSDVNEHMLRACKLIVNCTPVGTYPNVAESIELPFQELTEEHLVVDLIYNPAQTTLLKRAKEAGATVLNGESMLRHQALRSWAIWNEAI